MTWLDDYHSKREHDEITTFFYLNVPVDGTNRTITFYTAIPRNTMDKRLLFIPDISQIDVNGNSLIDKRCYFCFEICLDCYPFDEFNNTSFQQFDYQEEIEESTLYVCGDCVEKIQKVVYEHQDSLDTTQLLSENI